MKFAIITHLIKQVMFAIFGGILVWVLYQGKLCHQRELTALCRFRVAFKSFLALYVFILVRYKNLYRSGPLNLIDLSCIFLFNSFFLDIELILSYPSVKNLPILK